MNNCMSCKVQPQFTETNVCRAISEVDAQRVNTKSPVVPRLKVFIGRFSKCDNL